ncbi:MFS general substrate transporter [Panus rudis PR-1116 ss-1]|nr:MFS general substrate transporter [Panus rudis PR-1116 ss-1]
MSQTEVQTALGYHPQASKSSLSIRAHSPQPPSVAVGPSTSRADSLNKGNIELAELGHRHSATGTVGGTSGTKTAPGDGGAPSTASDTDPHLFREYIQYAVLCFSLFMAGWNDGTTGPLLPRIQEVYHVNFAIVSLIFVFNCVGFVTGAGLNVYLTDRLGFGKVMVLGSSAQLIGYAIDASAPPFPALCLGYCINGFGLALQDAGANGYVACYEKNAAARMGILHAVYGLGALAAPLVSTQFSQLPRWSFHFLVSVGVAAINTIGLIAVFRFKTQDECLREIGQTPEDHSDSSRQDNKYRQIFRLREVHLLAFFILIYVGVEVTLGGWIVTYIINERGGGPSSGYISSGFFGGLTFGRVALLWVNKAVGEQRVMYFYIVLSIALELVVWLVPSLVGGGIAVSIVGALLGPIYPIVMNHSGRILPPWLLTGSIGWIAGFGQAGSALLPFLTGAIASRKGIGSLQPLLISMMGFLLVLWFLVPSTSRRVD